MEELNFKPSVREILLRIRPFSFFCLTISWNTFLKLENLGYYDGAAADTSH